MSTTITHQLFMVQERLAEVERDRDYYKSLVESFFNGCVPETGGNLQHFIMAKYGRLRKESMAPVPRLLEPAS